MMLTVIKYDNIISVNLENREKRNWYLNWYLCRSLSVISHKHRIPKSEAMYSNIIYIMGDPEKKKKQYRRRIFSLVTTIILHYLLESQNHGNIISTTRKDFAKD